MFLFFEDAFKKQSICSIPSSFKIRAKPSLYPKTDLLCVSFAAKLVLVVDALAVVHQGVLGQLQPLEEAVPSLYGAALVRGPGLNTGNIRE